MKRANQLQPLSRQHHLGLNLSRHAKECPAEIASVLETLDVKHRQLYKLMDETERSHKFINKEVAAAQVQALGTLLYDLIRFEERELYPAVEKHLTEAELNAIYEASPDSIKRTDELC